MLIILRSLRCAWHGSEIHMRDSIRKSSRKIILNEPDTNPFEVSNYADIEDASDSHLWIDSDQEGDNDQDVDVLFWIYWVLNVLFEFIAYWVFLWINILFEFIGFLYE